MTWQTRSSLTPKVLSENQWQLHWLSVENEFTHFQQVMQLYLRVKKKPRGIGTVIPRHCTTVYRISTIINYDNEHSTAHSVTSWHSKKALPVSRSIHRRTHTCKYIIWITSWHLSFYWGSNCFPSAQDLGPYNYSCLCVIKTPQDFHYLKSRNFVQARYRPNTTVGIAELPETLYCRC